MNPREKAQAIEQVSAHIRRAHLSLDGLVEYGGQDLNNPRRAAKAKRVEKAWALMAGLKVKHTDLGD